MNTTSIKISKETLKELSKIKEYPRETYEDTIKRLMEKYINKEN
jgi:predicted CopG family antitoxin